MCTLYVHLRAAHKTHITRTSIACTQAQARNMMILIRFANKRNCTHSHTLCVRACERACIGGPMAAHFCCTFEIAKFRCLLGSDFVTDTHTQNPIIVNTINAHTRALARLQYLWPSNTINYNFCLSIVFAFIYTRSTHTKALTQPSPLFVDSLANKYTHTHGACSCPKINAKKTNFPYPPFLSAFLSHSHKKTAKAPLHPGRCYMYVYIYVDIVLA